MGRNGVAARTLVICAVLLLGGCALEPVIAPDAPASSSPRPSRSVEPSPTPSTTPPVQPSPTGTAEEDGHDGDVAHPPADPSLTAATAFSACKAEGKRSLFTDDPDAAWQPLSASYVERVDGVWRVHSGVTTTSADVASGSPFAFCQVTGSNSAPVILTIGSTLSPPDDPGLWALPEG